MTCYTCLKWCIKIFLSQKKEYKLNFKAYLWKKNKKYQQQNQLVSSRVYILIWL